MNALGGDPLPGVDELDEPHADRARRCGLARTGEVKVVVVLDLGPRDDLVEQVVAPRVLEVDGDPRCRAAARSPSSTRIPPADTLRAIAWVSP